jgi:hypothetical protein
MPAWLSPLLNWSYWFGTFPQPFTGVYFWIVVGLAGTSFLVGLLFSFINSHLKDPSTRRIVKRLGNLGLTLGCLMAISFFFTQTSTPTLGSRFWFLLWFIVAIIWFGFILKYAFRVAPKERAERAKQLEYQKYLPR